MKTIKSRLILLGTLLALVIIGTVAKAEEQAPVKLSEVPQRVITTVQEAPAKIQAWAQAEWQETKEFQAKGWADGKAQLNRSWTQIKGLFSNTKSTN